MNTTSYKSPKALKFAVIVTDGRVLPAWQAECVRSLTARPELELAVFVEDVLQAKRSSLIYRISRWLVCRPRTEKFVKMPAGGRNVPTMRISTTVADDAKRIESFRKANEKIEQLDLDFILDFRLDSAENNLLKGARFGVWAFSFGERLRVGDPVLTDLRDGQLTTRFQLNRFDGSSGERTTQMSGNIRTVPQSPSATVDSVLVSASKLPELVCNALLRGRDLGRPATGGGGFTQRVRPAGFFDAVTLLLRTAAGFTGRLRRAFFAHDEWNIGIVKSPISSFLDSDFQPEIEWIPDLPAHCFRADPFAVKVNEDRFLFFEQLDYREGRGKIRFINLDGDSPSAEGEVDLGTDVHLSYPYIISHENEIYCVPETNEAGEIALYRATAFPSKWEKVTTLISGFPGADASLFVYDGRWWLACTRVGDGSHDKLHLWYANDIEGPWNPHSGNPVKIDARSARPAGTPFWHAGNLYRPAQDSSGSYGGRVIINRVDELTPDFFSERSVAVVGPFADSKYPDGAHTISAIGDWTVIDARRSVFDSRAFIGTVGRGLASLLTRLSADRPTERPATKIEQA